MTTLGKVYVGTSLHNAERAQQIQKRFRDAGCIITYDWTTHGQVHTEEELIRFGIEEEKGIQNCDVFFMIFPARTGTHWEGGLARGLQLAGKKIAIVILMEEDQEKKTFHYLDGVSRFTDEDAAIEHSLSFINNISRS
jgi:hypothetical protein